MPRFEIPDALVYAFRGGPMHRKILLERVGKILKIARVVGFSLLLGSGPARAQTAEQRCAASKIEAAGKKAACLLKLDARTAKGAPPPAGTAQHCEDRLSSPTSGAFARAEAHGGCAVTGDAPTVEGQVDDFVASVDSVLEVGTPNACQSAKLKAAGKDAQCVLTADGRTAAGRSDPGALQACGDKLATAFAKAEARGGCATSGDAMSIAGSVGGFAATIVAEEPTAVTCATAGCPAPVACDSTAGPCWQPPTVSRWQYQLQAALTAGGACAFPTTGGIDVGITAVPFTGGGAASPAVYDIDFLTDPACAPGGSNDVDNAAAVTAVHAAGGHAICYLDAGTDEPFRPDHQAYVDFDQSCGGCLFGKPVSGFREEHWLDIENDHGQRAFVLGQVSARLDRCRADGFDAVEFDNVEAYANDTGLPISASAQLLFNSALANLAHSKGLSVALKNDLGQIPDLVPYFDLAINEQCQQYDECAALDPFLAAGKAVLQVEYQVGVGTFCPPANAAGRNAIAKSVDLFDVPWTPCR